MTPALTLCYCANGNPRFAAIAAAAGFAYGAQLPGSVPEGADLFMADQDWKAPNRAAYMTALAKHRPAMATVLDWEAEEQLPEVLSWAEEAAQWARDFVCVIPKVPGQIDRIPDQIGGKSVVLGYSVPTRFGATPVPQWEFAGRRVHLLGGSPHRQMREWLYLSCHADVISADGNMAQKMATQQNRFWQPSCAGRSGMHDRSWPTLKEADGGVTWGQDAPYEAFRRSCENVAAAWHDLTRAKKKAAGETPAEGQD